MTYLRRLVTVMTAIMIVGFIVIVALFVTKFSGGSRQGFPEEISLPNGTVPTAITRGDGWYAVVTAENEILIFDASSGTVRQTIKILTGP